MGECACGAVRKDPAHWDRLLGLQSQTPQRERSIAERLSCEYREHPRPAPEKAKPAAKEKTPEPAQEGDEYPATWAHAHSAFVNCVLLRGPKTISADVDWYKASDPFRDREPCRTTILAKHVVQALKDGCRPGQFKLPMVSWPSRESYKGLLWGDMEVVIDCRNFLLRFPVVRCDYPGEYNPGDTNWANVLLRVGKPITEAKS